MLTQYGEVIKIYSFSIIHLKRHSSLFLTVKCQIPLSSTLNVIRLTFKRQTCAFLTFKR